MIPSNTAEPSDCQFGLAGRLTQFVFPPGSSIIAASAWSVSNISCIWASNHSSSIASSSEAPRHGGATRTTVIVTGSCSRCSKTAKLHPARRSSTISGLKAEPSRQYGPATAICPCRCRPPKCHPVLCNLLRTRDEYRRLGHAWNPKGPNQGRVGFLKFPGNQPALGKESVRAHDERQWETSLGMRTTDEQTYLAHNWSRGSAPSSGWDIGDLP